nr:MAG TPA: hypothetical protein [Caudoviricetes sp.]
MSIGFQFWTLPSIAIENDSISFTVFKSASCDDKPFVPTLNSISNTGNTPLVTFPALIYSSL